ncbi:nucleolar protein [Neisseria mucosa]|uniref:Nucleolar protein n=2 Tax=Neisseriaceae TaxID=481 RepID=A0A0C1GX85_9NEIS|nr:MULTISPECIES: hypothetical protein [Neisseriaceae]KIC06462.1 hypothetical protein MCC93_20910 [Morococcus cerebrosus]MDK6725682.1 nucleolar protein [Neisseria mucosa]MDK6870094.1 nucleolar protein [Neisseria mucosa]MDK8109740.1 nucleolar protein [Neisseria mucosa]MDK8361401.1 nucleolar protein [Neisseria mucosa]
MRSRIKQGALIVASSLILGLSLHTAAAVFSCHSGNSKTYTSEPSGNCTGTDLPKISSHQGGAYRLKINKLSSDTEEKAAKLKRARSKEKSREKAQEQETKSKNAKSRAKKSDKAAKTSSENE